jgi:hypothetical protein
MERRNDGAMKNFSRFKKNYRKNSACDETKRVLQKQNSLIQKSKYK